MKSEMPVITPESGHQDHRETHPAYGLVQVTRVSGQATLFDSEFKHQHYICLRIKSAEVLRGLSNNWIHEKGGLPHVEIEMSEAQWATAISSLNSGSGTPCTLKYIGAEQVPKIDRDPKLTDNKFKQEMRECMAEGIEAMDQLESIIKDSKMTNKLRGELLGKLERAQRSCGGSSAGFVADQYAEYMEGVKEKGKAELHAHAQSIGLSASSLIGNEQ